jgi:hypothetical protein
MRGVLMFAHNNELFDYGKMAYASALSVAYHIDEPISLVTDEQTWENLLQNYPTARTSFDEPIIIEVEDKNYRNFDLVDGTRTKAKYHNLSRLRAYELSPYDETLLIDTDVLIQDSSLRGVWGSLANIRMNREISHMIKNERNRKRDGDDISLTTFWATICYFRKCKMTEDFFSLSKYVADNYDYYGVLYEFPTNLLRMDYVLTIAAHIMSGYVYKAQSVIEPLPTNDTVFTWNRDIMIDVEKNRATFLINSNGQMFPVSTYRTVHCMNKESMMNMADRIIDCYA